MTPKRKEILRDLCARRQMDTKVVLENVRDLHNVGAVLRTCDAVGVPEIHISMQNGFKKSRARMGKQTSAGSRKWVDVFMRDSISCLQEFKSKGFQVFGTALNEDSISVYDIDFTRPTVIVFGNEQHGLTEDALSLIDGSFIIPQHGMVQSLNISVACAISLYEMMRQRQQAGLYDNRELNSKQQQLFERFLDNHPNQSKGEIVPLD